ncbi:MAG TPA: hypothetical protein VGM93_05700 [Acidimicrobiales bacterium]
MPRFGGGIGKVYALGVIIAGAPGLVLTLSGGLALLGSLATASSSSDYSGTSGDIARITGGVALLLLVLGLVTLIAALFAAAGNGVGRVTSIVIMLLGAVVVMIGAHQGGGFILAIPPLIGSACLAFGSPDL